MFSYPEGPTYTHREVVALVHAGTVEYGQVEPVVMPGGETWYRVVPS